MSVHVHVPPNACAVVKPLYCRRSRRTGLSRRWKCPVRRLPVHLIRPDYIAGCLRLLLLSFFVMAYGGGRRRVPSLPLGYMANYLSELTLVEYSFVKFVPSVIAASAVFLARWTLDQSDQPWNCTLQHYTSYKALDLKSVVLQMHYLQQNSCNSPLSAVRDKYIQEKYERVACRVSPKLPDSLFF
ncbi:hypothetical protein KFK09_029169 [Dendrobium nobile]|uniref:Cyclin C-terminal domain-containing protein n=1 Tax=Dendrobium nobile TaxID=94219 RepID=A0A8T3A524_DENNO|nr:hypothetical protein KFK09_029169 [Dendrobium nobile]